MGQVMAKVTGAQILDIIDGGSANNGQDAFIKLSVDEGGKHPSQITLFVAAEKVGVLISALATFAGMARGTRLGTNPLEEADRSMMGGFALPYASALPGVSLSQPGVALLTLQLDAGQGRKLNFPVAMNLDAIRSLSVALEHCKSAIEEVDISQAKNGPSSSQGLN